MARVSTKENKTKYQLIREELGLSREKASELLETIMPERIEKIENEKTVPHPDEVLTMAKQYKRPSLCNHYCSTQCPIGQEYVPEVEVKELSSIVLEMLASLNSVNKRKRMQSCFASRPKKKLCNSVVRWKMKRNNCFLKSIKKGRCKPTRLRYTPEPL